MDASEFTGLNGDQPEPGERQPLSADQLEQIQAVYDVVGGYFNMTPDEFVAGFERNDRPEDEIDAWMSITAAWIAYHEQHLDDKLLPPSGEKQLLSALIAIATGVNDAAQLGVSEEVGRRLLECFGEGDVDSEEDDDGLEEQ